VNTCDIRPFKYQSVPQPAGDSGSSSNQINEQALENYLLQLKNAVCTDLQDLVIRLADLEARVAALEP
jgi:hypothetical protein